MSDIPSDWRPFTGILGFYSLRHPSDWSICASTGLYGNGKRIARGERRIQEGCAIYRPGRRGKHLDEVLIWSSPAVLPPFRRQQFQPPVPPPSPHLWPEAPPHHIKGLDW